MTRKLPPECIELFERLSEYIDGDMTPERCRELEEHLDDCWPCGEFVESFRQTIGLCKELPTPALPDEARTCLKALIARELSR
jgi:anti-sigma factor RsiW